MMELKEMKSRVQKDYTFSYGELGVPVSMCIDTYNSVLGRIHDGYTRAYDRKSGLLGVIFTKRHPMRFTPTFALNTQRMQYVKDLTKNDDLRLGGYFFITLDELAKAPGFDNKHMELIEMYRGREHDVMCRVVYVEPSYGVHIVVHTI